jgi:glycosyltransferase involved in cell wall biosynthesis
MKCVYVTKNLPFGVSEAFIFSELEDHIRAGIDITVVPLMRAKLVHAQKGEILARTKAKSLIDVPILFEFLRTCALQPFKMLACLRDIASSRDLNIAIRNAAVLPKAAWLARLCRSEGIDHIHSHWLAVPSTMALFASRLSGTPFSITAHRYDIAQRNLIDAKGRHARFVRAIDEAGLREIKAELKKDTPPPILVRMGVPLPSKAAPASAGHLYPLRVIVGARLVEKKGIAFLIKASSLLRERGQAITIDVFGEGPLEAPLRAMADTLGVLNSVNFRGPASHDDLLSQLASGRYHVAVLPSVVATDGDKEGIPVFLMEAMATGLPVIGTDNGGMLELLHNGAGLVVPQKNEVELAAALERIAKDENLRASLILNGRRRISEQFNAQSAAERLRELFSRATEAGG